MRACVESSVILNSEINLRWSTYREILFQKICFPKGNESLFSSVKYFFFFKSKCSQVIRPFGFKNCLGKWYRCSIPIRKHIFFHRVYRSLCRLILFSLFKISEMSTQTRVPIENNVYGETVYKNSSYYLKVLETIFIKTKQPFLCKQKSLCRIFFKKPFRAK